MSLLSCDNIRKESFHNFSKEEKVKLSKKYQQLAELLEKGSPNHMRLLEKALRINPNNDMAWRQLSLPYLYAGMLKEWHYHMDNAIKLNPQVWQGWRAYDRLYYLRDYSGALYDLDATDTLTVNQVDYLENTSVDYLRGLCYLGLNNFEMAHEFFDKFIDHEVDNVGEKFVDERVYLYKGMINIQEQKYFDAIKNLKRGIEFEEGNADFHYHLSVAFCHLGDLKEAREQLNIAIKKSDQENRLLGYRYGYRYEPIGRVYDEDIEDLKTALEM